jgi:hypothetical protein
VWARILSIRLAFAVGTNVWLGVQAGFLCGFMWVSTVSKGIEIQRPMRITGLSFSLEKVRLEQRVSKISTNVSNTSGQSYFSSAENEFHHT